MKHQRVANKTDQQKHKQPFQNPVLQTRTVGHPLLQLQQTIGNQAFLQLLRSGVLQAELEASQSKHLVQAKETPHHVPEVTPAVHGHLDALRRGGQPKRAADSEKASAPQAKKENEFLPAVDEDASKESAAEAAVGRETLQSPAMPEKAPASPEEDSAYQAVAKQLETKAKHQKTPPLARGSQVGKAVIKEASERKKKDTESAAQLPPKDSIEQTNKAKHLDKLDQKQQEQPEFTVEDFMKEFEKTTTNLAEKLPKTKKERDTVDAAAKLSVGKMTAKLEFDKQYQPHAESLRTEADKDISAYPDSLKQAPETYELKADDPGSAPKIKHANTAAPKPKTDAEISLDDKSRSLDDALLNHSVNGQVINIKEDSLTFPISGEETFDEAAAAKRKAQDEIQKAKPRYREEEGKVISKSQAEMQSLVKNWIGWFPPFAFEQF